MSDICTGAAAFDIKDQTISNVRKGFKCVIIPNNIISIERGTSSSYAFQQGKDMVNKVDFSEAKNLEVIGAYAFYQCAKILSVDLTACTKLRSIEMSAFYYCKGINSIQLPDSPELTVLTSGCFSYTAITSFKVPKSILTIEGTSTLNGGNDGVFANCESLISVEIETGSKLKSIGDKAFLFTSITKLDIPETVETISSATFRICKTLHSINVHPDNSKYSSVDGVLLSKDKQKLIYYPDRAVEGTEIKLPSTVNTLCSSSFLGLSNYQTIDLTGITNIDGSAFERCDSIVSVNIPATVTKLNPNTFCQCSKLTNVTFNREYTEIPSNMFKLCNSLERFNIPSGVLEIKDHAFVYCQNLKYVFIPKTVTKIYTGAFISCHSTLQLDFEKGSPIVYTPEGYLYNSDQTKLIMYNGEATEAKIISSVATICEGAFQGSKIQTVTYESKDTVTAIEDSVFRECSSLTSIELPNAITYIGQFLFFSCIMLQSIKIPDSVQSIYRSAFVNCNVLSSVDFGNSQVTTVSEEAFRLCVNLQQITLPNTVSKIGRNAFESAGIITFAIPADLTVIGFEAFMNSKLQSISWPQETNYTTITTRAFSQATSLQSLTIPDYIISIEDSAFSKCSELQTVVFGKGLSSVAKKSFYACTKLHQVEVHDNTVLTTISYLVFDECTSLTEFVCNDWTNNFWFNTGIVFNRAKTNMIMYLRATKMEHITIPSGISVIDSYIFADCSTLKTVSFEGQSLKSINPYAFYNCSGLEIINFPSTLESIGVSAFEGCNIVALFLQEATKLLNIPQKAFAGNQLLRQLVLPPTIQTIDETAFSNVNSKAYVIYFGTKNIENTIGFRSSSYVIVNTMYTYDTFVGLKAVRDLNGVCSARVTGISRFNIGLCAIFFAIVC